jgi:hypothetical protein
MLGEGGKGSGAIVSGGELVVVLSWRRGGVDWGGASELTGIKSSKASKSSSASCSILRKFSRPCTIFLKRGDSQ